MKQSSSSANLQFLSGGGEMGELIRSKDWSKTAMGKPESWPQSLRTTLGIILNSKFPMLIYWGEDHIFFYNDAFRPSLGSEGKHPSILGLPGVDAWAEIWQTIKPLLDQALSGGEAVYLENAFIPIYRNGQIEDVYWTFSYSPITDEANKSVGIFVTCMETTDQVKALNRITESEDRFRNMAETADVLIAIGDETGDATYFNKAWVDLTGRAMKDLIQFGWTDLLHIDDRAGFIDLYLNAFEKRIPFQGVVRMKNHENKYRRLLVKGNPRFHTDDTFLGYMATSADITDSYEVEHILKENHERLNIIIGASGLGTWELNLKDRSVNYSDRYLEILGFPKGVAMSHEELLKRLHPDDLETREKAFKTAFRSGLFNYEGRLIWKDGTIHWMESRGKVIYNKEGEAEKMIGTIRDITEEKLHEQELVKRETRFRLLADSMPQHIWTADTDGNLNYFNLSVYKYSGFSETDIMTKGWLDIVHPDDKEENIKAWIHSIKTGVDFIFEHRFRRHDGIYRWQLSRATPQRDEYGNIQMWVGTSTDIQDQKLFTTELEKQVRNRTKELKELNETLAKSEERYHLMVEEVQDYAILYLNKQGIVENWNKGAEKIKGYKASEIIGKSFSNFYTPEDRKTGLPEYLLGQAEKTGRAKQEGWRMRKDGTYFWANVTITAVHNEAGEVIGFSKVTHDLTDKKHTDEQLKTNAATLEQKNAELEKMNKELESFAYISSHDLQEPLRKIQTFSSRILDLEYESLSENAKDNFNRMQSAAKRMQALIEDLLVYSRTSDAERKYVKTDLGKLIGQVKEDMEDEFAKRNATLEVGEMIKADVIPFQFRQLMQNLLSNSLKFAKENIPAHIKITCETNTGKNLNVEKLQQDIVYCHLKLEDNGIGFEPEYSEKIFEVFQRLHGKTEYVGTGIGLAIVKKIIDNLNGLITATGELHKGAQFDIYFPVNAKK